MNSRERQAAISSSQAASNAGADTPAALCEMGFGHLRAGQYAAAQHCAQQALAMDIDHAGSLHLMGLLSLHAQQYDHAVEWISRAIRQDPRPEYLASLGLTLKQQGRREEAVKVFEKAVQLKPDDTTLWTKLGEVLEDLNRSSEALLSFQHALTLDPSNWMAANKSGHLLYRSGRMEEALKCFVLCDALQPNQAATLHIRGICRYGLKRFDDALADMVVAQALDPADPGICNNVGLALKALDRDEEALDWFDRSLALRPDYSDALHNKAISLARLRQFEQAFAIYEGLRISDPGDALAEMGIAQLHLFTGNFEAGWRGREARWKDPALAGVYPKLPQPMWLGNESLEGKTIFIGADEGLGDTIQFVRYVPMLAALGARVILAVQDPLQPLLADMPGVAQCLPMSATRANPLPAFDVHCPIMSLPAAFGTTLQTVPAAVPYLPCPAEERIEAWERRLGPRDKLRVGLVWSGNPGHQNDRSRSISFRHFSPIFDVDATFVSLQKDPRPDDKAALFERNDIVDWTADLTDFVETAALVSCLDLVISVDTSVAHLAGALGRPIWIVLAYNGEYRWMLDREDSPWYPTARLFRQSRTRDYASLFDGVKSELMLLGAAARPRQPDA